MINIENYELCEVRPVRVGNQSVELECGSNYPIEYKVTVTLDDGRWASGKSYQRDEYDSAYHEGFEPAYESACRQLGVTPLNR